MSMKYVKKRNDKGLSGCLKCSLYYACLQLPKNYCEVVGNEFEDYYERT